MAKMRYKTPGSRNNYMTKGSFKNLKLGDELVLRFMLGENEVTSRPYIKNTTNDLGETVKTDCIKVKFHTGPWAGKELELVRQQIQQKR